MKLNDQIITNVSKKRRPAEVTSLVLDNLGIGSAAALERYGNLLLLSLRFNQLQNVAFLRRCPRIWVLELQQNPVLSSSHLA